MVYYLETFARYALLLFDDASTVSQNSDSSTGIFVVDVIAMYFFWKTEHEENNIS